MSTTLNIGHARGRAKATLILPVLARDEEPQPTTQESMFNFVRLSDGGTARHAGPRSEISILSDIALRTCGEGGPVDWRLAADHGHLRQLIAQMVPGWEKIGAIDTTKEEFHLEERLLHLDDDFDLLFALRIEVQRPSEQHRGGDDCRAEVTN